ncbi:MAG: restriction endonuclease [Chloroflexi bacterium 44-23]|nr:MAG: restriction endonuclease [Chloroflexi bacterium 44-23]
MTLSEIPQFIRESYEIHEWRHASAVLSKDFPHEWADLMNVLLNFRLKKSSIISGGGRKSPVAQAIDDEFYALGWEEKTFRTEITIDGVSRSSPTHAVDYYKNHVAIETEWNNKNPFYDRDLNNFRMLFDLHVISVGVIITRCDELQEIFASIGRGTSFGNSTTHLSKLLPLIQGGAGGGCPLLIFGISKKLYDENE